MASSLSECQTSTRYGFADLQRCLDELDPQQLHNDLKEYQLKEVEFSAITSEEEATMAKDVKAYKEQMMRQSKGCEIAGVEYQGMRSNNGNEAGQLPLKREEMYDEMSLEDMEAKNSREADVSNNGQQHRPVQLPESYHFLFIYAPGWHTKVIAPQKKSNGKVVLCKLTLSLQEDKEKREQEINSFCETSFPTWYQQRIKYDQIQKRAEVTCPDDIFDGINKFFLGENEKCKASGALTAVIVFFGHGSRQGFQVRIDNESVRLDEIIVYVWYCWKKSRSQDLPKRVKIIFGQCYSHVYDKSLQFDALDIVEVTNDGHLTTLSKTNKAGKSYIEELEPVANAIRREIEKKQKQEQVNDMENGRKTSDIDAVPKNSSGMEKEQSEDAEKQAPDDKLKQNGSARWHKKRKKRKKAKIKKSMFIGFQY